MKKIMKYVTGAVIMAPIILGLNGLKVDAASGKVAASTLNVRAIPNTSGKVIGKLPKNSSINYTNYNGSWVKIKYKNKTAYVSKKYIKSVSMQTVNYKGKVTASKLNIRPGLGSKNVITQLKKGTIVKVTRKSNEWVYVSSGKVKGWAAVKYISKIEETKTSQTPVANSYATLDIRYPSKVKAEAINQYIDQFEKLTNKNSVFKGKGQLFIDVGIEAGINPLILASMAIHESAFGTNELSYQKFNLFSVGAYDEDPLYFAHTFQSVEHAIKYQVKFIIEDYLNPSSWKFKGTYLGDAIGGLNYYYATDKQWGQKIASHANKIHPFNALEHTNISLMTSKIPNVTAPIKPEPKK